MTNLQKQPAYRQRHRSPSPLLESNWQPIGLVVRRLMKRHGLPTPTAIITAEAARLHVGSDR